MVKILHIGVSEIQRQVGKEEGAVNSSPGGA